MITLHVHCIYVDTKRFNKIHNEVSVLFAKFINSGHTTREAAVQVVQAVHRACCVWCVHVNDGGGGERGAT